MAATPAVRSERATNGRELVVHDTAPVTLFRTDNPKDVVARATETAKALSEVVKKQKLATSISGRDHVRVEGWTLLGTMLGVFAVCTWTRKLDNGWEARVEARTRGGEVVGAAEAQCLRTEKTWATRDDYALRSMAQTRATSKALRQPLGFVMTLAGFDATPAEEMPVAVAGGGDASPFDAGADGANAPTDKQIKMVHALITKIGKAEIDGLGEAEIRQGMGAQYGSESVKDLTKTQISDLITRLKAKETELGL